VSSPSPVASPTTRRHAARRRGGGQILTHCASVADVPPPLSPPAAATTLVLVLQGTVSRRTLPYPATTRRHGGRRAALLRRENRASFAGKPAFPPPAKARVVPRTQWCRRVVGCASVTLALGRHSTQAGASESRTRRSSGPVPRFALLVDPKLLSYTAVGRPARRSARRRT
jgi:hypothetical protein